jgi:hypothetical protein
LKYILEEKEFNEKLEEEHKKGRKFGRGQAIAMVNSALTFRYNENNFHIPENVPREEKELVKRILKINKLLKENKLIEAS